MREIWRVGERAVPKRGLKATCHTLRHRHLFSQKAKAFLYFQVEKGIASVSGL
jgi:hypothetical protein